MIIFKCKMCGGDLHPVEGATTCECEYCGSVQTIPTADNEKKMNLFGRAQRLLRDCEFDKAAGVYESIAAEFPKEAEACWGLVLCKYGIEYVDDPATGKKVPTCHRSGFDSVMDDTDFRQACENADAVARRVYMDEAQYIEELRKGIIEVSSREAPYDIFICYKETDENGGRTLDSVLAQDIFDALTEKGYRVFFSRITLEDKLGQEYEPYIFAALNSAKVMLAVGTSYNHYNAVWVKNEWSRFLKLIAAGGKKTLIPCYKGIDAYDMPKEFARLQAQDMGKVGAMQDLLRGIEKIVSRNQARQAPAAQTPREDNIAPMLDRGFICLRGAEFDKADQMFEQVLNLDPKNANAYLGKLMVERKVCVPDDLAGEKEFLQRSASYRNALEYADTRLKRQLGEYQREAERNTIAGLKRDLTAFSISEQRQYAAYKSQLEDMVREKEGSVEALTRQAADAQEKFEKALQANAGATRVKLVVGIILIIWLVLFLGPIGRMTNYPAWLETVGMVTYIGCPIALIALIVSYIRSLPGKGRDGKYRKADIQAKWEKVEALQARLNAMTEEMRPIRQTLDSHEQRHSAIVSQARQLAESLDSAGSDWIETEEGIEKLLRSVKH